jgi:hypothetical protein
VIYGGVAVWRTASTGLLYALCDDCGWASRNYRNPELARTAKENHVCKPSVLAARQAEAARRR